MKLDISNLVCRFVIMSSSIFCSIWVYSGSHNLLEFWKISAK